uniref:Saposin B-type domain-containing protein n=1 Tax=Strigamia maritima TaxID=126957 RepID=T1IYT3_STRMM
MLCSLFSIFDNYQQKENLWPRTLVYRCDTTTVPTPIRHINIRRIRDKAKPLNLIPFSFITTTNYLICTIHTPMKMHRIWLLLIFHCIFRTCDGGPFWMFKNAPTPIESTNVPSSFYDNSDRLIYFESDTNQGNSIKESRTGPTPRERTLPLFLVRFLSIFELNRVVRELETSSMSSVSCFVCKWGIGILRYLLAAGATENDIASKVETFCIDLHIESERVCKGVVETFKHEILHVLAKTNFTLIEICAVIVGESCGESTPDLNWTVSFTPVPKPPVVNVPLPKPGAPVLRVLHLSDTHFDMYYKEGADAECGEPLCCRMGDKIMNGSRAAGKWGDYRKCDTPLRTIESMFEHIAKNFKLDYILWTGDLPPHDIWNQSRTDQIYVLKQTTKLFMKYFPNVPIFPALGNHEGAPVNSFPPPFVKGNDSIAWLYDELIDAWGNWLPNYTTPTIRKGAFYSVLVSPGFRIISLNLNYCNNRNWWLLLNTTDPAEELQWLIYELQYAEFKKEKVHIIGHIPPGMEDCIKIWSANYYKIINRFESTIASQFFGHTHMDEFEIFYDEVDVTRPTNLAYVGPSVTPYVGLNPAFRIYTIDGLYTNSSYAVLDHENYMMDLESANKNGTASWFKLYSAKDSYRMNSMQPTDWDKLVKQMVADDTIFQRYYKYYHRASSAFPTCDQKCKHQLLCAVISGKSHDPSQCYHLRKLLYKT